MNPFRTDASVTAPALAHTPGCGCPLHQRRLFTGLIAGVAAGSLAPGAV